MARKRRKTTAILVMTDENDYLLSNRLLSQITEFASNFESKVYRVTTRKKDEIISSVDAFATTLCDKDYKFKGRYKLLTQLLPLSPTAQIKEVKLRVPKPVVTLSREQLRERTNTIRTFIRNRLASGSTITLDDISEEFNGENISRASLSNHLSHVRQSLMAEGNNVVGIGRGSYQIRPRSTIWSSYNYAASTNLIPPSLNPDGSVNWGSYNPPISPVMSSEVTIVSAGNTSNNG